MNLNRLVGLIAVVLFSATACSKNGVDATVESDCTGVYLRIKQKDYKVCNEEMIEAFAEGTVVKADFKKLASCAAQDTLIRCELYHEFESWIEITKIEYQDVE